MRSKKYVDSDTVMGKYDRTVAITPAAIAQHEEQREHRDENLEQDEERRDDPRARILSPAGINADVPSRLVITAS